jgi:hypothetical protein
MKYNPKVVSYGLSVLTATAALIGAAGPLQAQNKKPNILVIMGDDNAGTSHFQPGRGEEGNRGEDQATRERMIG